MDEGVALCDYLAVLINTWWIVVIIFAVAVAAGLVVSSQLSPVYKART